MDVSPAQQHHIPSWLSRGDPESVYPALVAVLAAIALQVAIPKSYTLVPRWPLLVLEGLLLLSCWRSTRS
jgi:hypothetical protein